VTMNLRDAYWNSIGPLTDPDDYYDTDNTGDNVYLVLEDLGGAGHVFALALETTRSVLPLSMQTLLTAAVHESPLHACGLVRLHPQCSLD
jgi:hypothetical protein